MNRSRVDAGGGGGGRGRRRAHVTSTDRMRGGSESRRSCRRRRALALEQSLHHRSSSRAASFGGDGGGGGMNHQRSADWRQQQRQQGYPAQQCNCTQRLSAATVSARRWPPTHGAHRHTRSTCSRQRSQPGSEPSSPCTHVAAVVGGVSSRELHGELSCIFASVNLICLSQARYWRDLGHFHLTEHWQSCKLSVRTTTDVMASFILPYGLEL